MTGVNTDSSADVDYADNYGHGADGSCPVVGLTTVVVVVVASGA